MLLGCIADDFTGASDLANTLSRQGMYAAQFNGIPQHSPVDCDAGVVALKTRSVPVDKAVEESLRALDWLIKQGCEQFFFKYCSTFDSTEVGNIGPVAEALLDRLKGFQAIVCPAFPGNGRTLYNGHLFVNGRLLNESGMEKHPLTPMADPDIVRWLQKSTRSKVGLVDERTVQKGSFDIKFALNEQRYNGNRLVVVDAICNEDLMAIGRAVADHRLISGGSGVALGLPANFYAAGKLKKRSPRTFGVKGPAVVLSGSCSAMSQRQLTRFLDEHKGFQVHPAELLNGKLSIQEAVSFANEHAGEVVAIFSSATPETVAAAQKKFGRETVASAIEEFFGELAVELVNSGFVRLVVGGGETSGAVVKALKIDEFILGNEIDPGVPALFGTSGSHEVALALKSGNFGRLDFYEYAVGALSAGNTTQQHVQAASAEE
jgi:uncharacterized protein YgbK (DUF1537 family)